MPVTIFNQSESVILDRLGQLRLSCFICLQLVEILIFLHISFIYICALIFFFMHIARVGGFNVVGSQLHRDKAFINIWVLNALDIAIFNLCERHVLVVLLIVLFVQVRNELFSVSFSFLIEIKVLVEE